MHSSNFNPEPAGVDVLVAVTTLVTEGRIPKKLNPKQKIIFEISHCSISKSPWDHECNLSDETCVNNENLREEVLKFWLNNIPLCVEVLLACGCEERDYSPSDLPDNELLLEQWHFSINHKRSVGVGQFKISQLVTAIRSQLYFSQITAWLTMQDETSEMKLTNKNIRYRLGLPGETLETSKFISCAIEHKFPVTDIGNNFTLNVSFFSLPRMSSMPNIKCRTCSLKTILKQPDSVSNNVSSEKKKALVDDRMHMFCKLKGKHHCEDFEENEDISKNDKLAKFKRLRQHMKEHSLNELSGPSTSAVTNQSKLPFNYGISKPCTITTNIINPPLSDQQTESFGGKHHIKPNIEHINKFPKWNTVNGFSDENVHTKCLTTDLSKKQDKSQILLDAIERSGHRTEECLGDGDRLCDVGRYVQNHSGCANKSECDNASCDMSESDNFSYKKEFNIYVDKHCDSPIPSFRHKRMKDISNLNTTQKVNRSTIRQKLTFDNQPTNNINATSGNYSQLEVNKCNKDSNNACVGIPTAYEQAKFRKNLDNAASMVFHSRTGLPLTSSPAPMRRGTSCFDFDSSINSVSAIKSALFSTSFSTDDESESDGSLVSPCSPDNYMVIKKEPTPIQHRRKGHAASLLGSFEESVLNGRLEPVSTVHGFTAELGASGSFVPKHLVVPVTVFFYTLGDNDKVSSPYLSHINLGKKGYNIPRIGTVQVTLFNPLGTVVKMFVIMYNLSDMPPNSQTFIRQRTLYMPTNCKDENLEWGPKWLRYLIHLRFMSSKSGKIYLHSDIRMIIFRKCDLDTATAHGIDMSYELRSFTHVPTNPRFSPRK